MTTVSCGSVAAGRPALGLIRNREYGVREGRDNGLLRRDKGQMGLKKQGFLGVTFDQRPTGKNWKARVNFKGMCINLGRFPDAFSAQLAYDQAVHILRPGGKTNFPIGQYPLDNADVAARIKALLPAPHPSLSESSSQTEEDSRQPALKQLQLQLQYQQHQQQLQYQQQQQWQAAMSAAAAGQQPQAATAVSSLVHALGLQQWQQQQQQQQPSAASRPHGSPGAGGSGSPASVGGAPAGGRCSSQAAGDAAAEPHHEHRALGLGVTYEPRPRSGKHYKARISHRGQSLNLGRFADAEGARQAYDQAAMVLRPHLPGRLNYPQHQSHSHALKHVNPDVARRLSHFLASLPPEEGVEAAGGGSSHMPAAAAAAAAGCASQLEEQHMPLQAQLLLQLLQHHVSSRSAAGAPAAAAAASDRPGARQQPNQQKRQHGQHEEQPSSKRLQVAAAGVEEEGWARVAQPEAAGSGDGQSGPAAFHVVYVPHALMERVLQTSGPAPEAAGSG